MIWWWVGNVLLFVVVIPLVIVLANSVVRPAVEIRKYADDILENGVLVTGNLDPIPALVDTRRMIGETLAGVGRYGAALDRLL